jgi:hypothetical protein
MLWHRAFRACESIGCQLSAFSHQFDICSSFAESGRLKADGGNCPSSSGPVIVGTSIIPARRWPRRVRRLCSIVLIDATTFL